MGFIFPKALYLLLLVPLYIIFNVYFEKKKIKDLIPFGNIEILIEAITKTRKIDFLKHLPLILKIIVLCLMIIALARPTSILYVPIRDTKVMLLIDNSISMEAKDIEPNRFIAARDAAEKFVKDLPKGIQIGVGLFSGNIQILVNPTTDKTQTLNVLQSLNIKDLKPGTAIGDAIQAGTYAIILDDKSKTEIKDNRILVLITDGESNIGSDPMLAAAKAKLYGIIIQAIGIGNPLGTIIRGGILTRLDEFTLNNITSLTEGHYFNAQNLEDMDEIYRQIKKTIRFVPKEKEITFIPVGSIFILLIIMQLLKWSKFRFS